MPTNPNRTTAVAGGNQQLIAGHLAHFKITFRNLRNDNHRRWPGKICPGDQLVKGVTYAVVSVADGDKNDDWTSVGFKDFSEEIPDTSPTEYYRTMTGIDKDGYTGEVQRGKFFVADDGDNSNQYYTTRMNFPLSLTIEPGTDLEPGTAYTIHTIGGTLGDNDFVNQFSDIDSADVIETGFTFTTNNVTDTGDAQYELNHFTEANGFHEDTRLVKGDCLTVLAYGSDFFEDGKLTESNAMMQVIHALQNFVSIAQVGPVMVTEATATEPKEGSVVVVLENWHGDITDRGMEAGAQRIKELLDRTFSNDGDEETKTETPDAKLKALVTYIIKELDVTKLDWRTAGLNEEIEPAATAGKGSLIDGMKYIVATPGSDTVAKWNAVFMNEDGTNITGSIPSAGDIVIVRAGQGAEYDDAFGGTVRVVKVAEVGDRFTVGDTDVAFTQADFGNAVVKDANETFEVVPFELK